MSMQMPSVRTRLGLAVALSIVSLAAGPAGAAPGCKKVHSHLFLEASQNPTCGSPIGLCAGATLQGASRPTPNSWAPAS